MVLGSFKLNFLLIIITYLISSKNHFPGNNRKPGKGHTKELIQIGLNENNAEKVYRDQGMFTDISRY